MLSNSDAYGLYQSLEIFIPLIVTDCNVVGHAEAFTAKNAVLPSAIGGLAMGLGATSALVSIPIKYGTEAILKANRKQA